MYFSFASEKVRIFALVIAVLAVAVFGTFALKRMYYGESGFTLIFTRVFGMEYNTLRYEARANEYYYRGTESASTTSAIPVLTYHAIITDKNAQELSPESFEGHNVGLSNFEDQMFALKRAGWNTITLDEFTRATRGEITVPKRSFLLTFDDGAKESFYPVDPILRALNFTAVLYVLPEYSRGDGSHYYLSQQEISRALESGRWEVGSHGLDTHKFIRASESGEESPALSNREWRPETRSFETEEEYTNRIQNDFKTSRTELEKMFNRPITTYAYPFGNFGQVTSNIENAVRKITSASGDIYAITFYQWWRGEGFTFNYPFPENAMRKRISVNPSWTGADLLTRLERGLPKSLPFTDTFDSDKGWLSTWGDVSVAHDELTISPRSSQSGASAILDGTGLLTDYELHATVTSPYGAGVTLIARYRDNNNLALCNIGNGFAHIEQTIDGENRVIKGERNDSIRIATDRELSLAMVVNGRSVECYLDGRKLVTTPFLDESLVGGGVGIKVWDRTIGNAVVHVKTLDLASVKNK